jgi:hypothetical protein
VLNSAVRVAYGVGALIAPGPMAAARFVTAAAALRAPA